MVCGKFSAIIQLNKRFQFVLLNITDNLQRNFYDINSYTRENYSLILSRSKILLMNLATKQEKNVIDYLSLSPERVYI